ncbi:hypothetical protein G7Y89_g11226 [Cudoniella acicularis]|uniref:Zn(2)-C6 fungal-type domain-containing protein n=1 Tax=Cudoniella acicularis TaxID=354080 RepID=A0A8H4RDX5_9HELO|nr:hypothetical protein G7Y89_g11226 [Cudoniella acicularis]
MSADQAAVLPDSTGDTSSPNADSQLRNAQSSSSSSPVSAPQTATEPKAAEKTISCVSCRKRKLKCDRVKPKCGTCSRLRHECEFPERRRNLGSKRRNMKELEARLAEVETKLVSEVQSQMAAKETPRADAHLNVIGDGMDLTMEDEFLDTSFDIQQFNFDLQAAGSTFPAEVHSQEVISLGLHEPLPSQEIMDELHKIYFEKYHPTIPMLHKYRYLASLDRAPHMRPPICLRYAIWMMAASLTDKYSSYEDVFYQRARSYLQEAEMKGYGEAFVDLYHAQTWGLIGTYEAKKTYFSRSWMSTGRMTRMCHMLGLHRLDGDGTDVKRVLPHPKDFIELEERRRCFWAAFYCDRWASSGTGWPMSIDEREIMTNLPVSEEAFEKGIADPTISLAEALTPAGSSKISTFGGVILSATLFGHNFQHLHRAGPNERPDDHSNGDFWKRHRKMDNVLSSTFMFLPDHLRMPANLRDPNIVFLHMNIHASSICLHQAAILTAERYKLDPGIIQQSRTRCLMAADEITNLMRHICHVDPSCLNSWLGFTLYVSGGVLLQNIKSEKPNPQSMPNLEFLLSAMNAIGIRHSITKHFTTQLEIDMEASGVPSYESFITKDTPNPSIYKELTCPGMPNVPNVPNVPMSGLLAGRYGVPLTLDDMRLFAKNAEKEMGNKSSTPLNLDSYPRMGFIPSPDSLTNKDASKQKSSPLNPPIWDKAWSTAYGASPISLHATSNTSDLGPRDHPVPPMTPMSSLNSNLFKPSCPFDIITATAPSSQPPCTTGITPPSDTSESSNTMQFPFRQGKYTNTEGSCPVDPSMFYSPPPEWSANGDEGRRFQSSSGIQGEASTDMNAFLDGIDWDSNVLQG